MNSMRDVLLGYLTWMESPSKQISVAGCLVTNHRGIPIEFRYTDPVRMTEEQKLLYGERSRTEALAITMAGSLWQSIEQKPGLLLVEDVGAARLWETLSSRENTLIACLEVAPEDIYLPTHHGGALVPLEADRERMARVRVFPDAPEALEHVENLLLRISEKMRLDEPFERVEAILKALHKLPPEETRYRSVVEAVPAEADPLAVRPGSTVQPRRKKRSPAKRAGRMGARPIRTTAEENLSSPADLGVPSARTIPAANDAPVREETDVPKSRFPSVEANRAALRRGSAADTSEDVGPAELIERLAPNVMEWWVAEEEGKEEGSSVVGKHPPTSSPRAQRRTAERDLKNRPDLQWLNHPRGRK